MRHRGRHAEARWMVDKGLTVSEIAIRLNAGKTALYEALRADTACSPAVCLPSGHGLRAKLLTVTRLLSLGLDRNNRLQ